MLYAEIGREVERAGCNSVDRRAVVAPLRKAAVMAKAMAALMAPAPAVRAVAGSGFSDRRRRRGACRAASASTTIAVRWWDLDRRLVWLIDLFERLERREQTQRY